jgi:hypothetical protein
MHTCDDTQHGTPVTHVELLHCTLAGVLLSQYHCSMDDLTYGRFKQR